MADQPQSNDARNPLDDPSAEDILLKRALHDVPVPAGLASRLKAHIRAQYAESASKSEPALTLHVVRAAAAEHNAKVALADAPADVISLSAVAEQDSLLARDRAGDEQESGWLRRSILVAAVAAALCGFAYLARQWTLPAEPSWLAAQCDAVLITIDQDNPANWQRPSVPVPATLVRVQSQLGRLAFVAERPLAALGSKIDGTVYRLDAGDGRGIFLMRLQSLPAVRGLTSRFEILPTPSGGWTLAAMTVGKETFVLAANCTEQQLFTYIRRPALT